MRSCGLVFLIKAVCASNPLSRNRAITNIIFYSASSVALFVRTCLRNQEFNANNNMKRSCAILLKSSCETCTILCSKVMVTTRVIGQEGKYTKFYSRINHHALISLKDFSNLCQLRWSSNLMMRAPVLIILEAATETSDWSTQCLATLWFGTWLDRMCSFLPWATTQ